MNGRKGQVTLFVIVGIIIILILGVFLYVYSSEEELERGEVKRDKVSQEFSPIQNYVESCVKDVGKEAVEILGERGGYIYKDDFPFASSLGIQPSLENPTDANAFYLNDFERVAVPYWYHVSSPNSNERIVYSSEKPKLISPLDDGAERSSSDKSIENQIDRYVELKLEKCINDFQAFNEKGFEVEKLNPNPIVTTFVTEDNVELNLYYPIKVKAGGDVEEIKNFGTTLPVRLKDIYKLAEMITKAEADFKFLEHNLADQISMQGMTDSDLLAPMHDFTFQFGGSGTTWTVDVLENNMKSLLSRTSLLQVQGAKNYDRIFVTPEDNAYSTRQKVYDNMVLPVVDKYGSENVSEVNLHNTNANINFLNWWDIYFNVNDDGGVVKPTTTGIDFPPLKLGFQKYNTLYDVSWPVLVSLRDDTAFAGEGYTFQFGLEGNLRDNEPVNSSYAPQINTAESGPSLCDEAQRDKNVSFEVYSNDCNDTGCEPVEGAAVILQVDDRACTLGETGSDGKLETEMSSGFMSGILKVSKREYLNRVMMIPAPEGGENYVFNGMRKKIPINFSVRKLTLSKSDYSWDNLSDSSQSLNQSEKAIVMLERVQGENLVHGEYNTGFSYNGSLEEVRIAPGRYNINAKLMGPPSGEINAQVLRELEDLDPGEYEDLSREEKEKIKNIQLSGGDSARGFKGGAKFEISEDGVGNPIVFNKPSLEENSEITIYVLELKNLNMSNVNDVNKMNNIDELTKIYQDELIPEFK